MPAGAAPLASPSKGHAAAAAAAADRRCTAVGAAAVLLALVLVTLLQARSMRLPLELLQRPAIWSARSERAAADSDASVLAAATETAAVVVAAAAGPAAAELTPQAELPCPPRTAAAAAAAAAVPDAVKAPPTGEAVGAAAAPGSGAPAPLPCLFNTLLRPGDVRWGAGGPNGTADQLAVADCALRRYTAAEARRCLAGKRLVFVGDSISRYQYLTLLHFLHLGDWPAPRGGVPGRPSVANEHEWESWNAFLRGTAALFGGAELCDCYREEAPPCWRPPCWKPPEDEKFENRHYRQGGLAVSHFTYTAAPNTVHGHYGFPPFSRGYRPPCAPATCSARADWAFPLAAALRGPIKDLRPTHLVLNSGLWGSSNALKERDWQDVAAAGREAVAEQRGRAIWRTTTASLGKKATSRQVLAARCVFGVAGDHDAAAVQAVGEAGWAVLDAYALTQPLLARPKPPLWDPRHFLAFVYRELNLYLLNLVCSPYA